MPWRSAGACGHSTRSDRSVSIGKVTRYEPDAKRRRLAIVTDKLDRVAPSASRASIWASRSASLKDGAMASRT